MLLEHYGVKLIGHSKNSFYTYYYKMSEVHFQQISSSNLLQKNDNIINLPGGTGTKKEILWTIDDHENKNIYFISSATSIKERKYTVYGFAVNYKGEQSDINELDKTALRLVDENVTYNMQVSPNDQCFMIYHDIIGKHSSNDKFVYKVYDLKNSSLLGKKTVSLQEQYRNFKIFNVTIDDDAKVFVGIFRKGRKEEGTLWNVCAYSISAEQSEVISLFKNNYPVDVTLIIDKNNILACIGLCGTSESRVPKSICCARYDDITLDLINEDRKVFGKDIIDPLTEEEKGINKGFGLSSLKIRSANILSDSSIVITSETARTESYDYGFNNKIVTARIGSDGSFMYVSLIPKSGNYVKIKELDYMITFTQNEVNYLFLDNARNYQGNNRIKDDPWVKFLDPAAFVTVAVNVDGKIKYNVLRQFKPKGFVMLPEYNMPLSEDGTKYLLLCSRPSGLGYMEFQFVTLTYQ